MTTLISRVEQGAIANELPKWIPATWEDYLVYRDDPNLERVRLFFNDNYLFVDDRSGEGINHAIVSNLFTLLFCCWFTYFTELTADSLGGCLIEKPNTRAATPDLILYIGERVVQGQEEEQCGINLNQWRVPDLVGEVADTTLATDLEEKKKLYADLGIPEYWAIDVKGKRVFAFRLQSDGSYEQIQESVALQGLPIALLEATLERLNQETNISAAGWFSQAIATLNAE